MAGAKFAARGIEPSENESEWLRAHAALSRLAKERAAADAEEGRWLLLALRSAVHVHLGFGSFGEYVERLFGYRPRSTHEKLRVAAALEQLPTIAQALSAGALSWSAVRELSRVAVAETEREWLELSRGKSVHQLEELVAGKVPGDTPGTTARTSARRHVLRFEVSAETLALWREAMAQLRRSSNYALDDDSALLLMARHVLGGPRDEGRASYQIALCLCPECGKGQQQASGELVPIGAEVVAMAHCDGQHLGLLRHPGNDSGDSNDVGPPTKALKEIIAQMRANPRSRTRVNPQLRTNTQTRTATDPRARPNDLAVRVAPASAHATKVRRARAGAAPTWARARGRALRPQRDARYGFAIIGAASSRVAGMCNFWICITSSSARREVGTRPIIWSRFARCTTEPCIAERWRSRAGFLRGLSFGMLTAETTVAA